MTGMNVKPQGNGMGDKEQPIGLLELLQKVKHNGNGLLNEARTAPQQIGEMFSPSYQKKLAMALKQNQEIDKDKWLHTGIELSGMSPFWWHINKLPPLAK